MYTSDETRYPNYITTTYTMMNTQTLAHVKNYKLRLACSCHCASIIECSRILIIYISWANIICFGKLKIQQTRLILSSFNDLVCLENKFFTIFTTTVIGKSISQGKSNLTWVF